MALAQQASLATISPIAAELSGNEALRLLEIIRDCYSVTNIESLERRIFAGVMDLIPFEFGGATLSLSDNSPCGLKHKQTFEITMPHEFRIEYERGQHFPSDTVAVENYRSFQPQYWSEADRVTCCRTVARESVYLWVSPPSRL